MVGCRKNKKESIPLHRLFDAGWLSALNRSLCSLAVFIEVSKDRMRPCLVFAQILPPLFFFRYFDFGGTIFCKWFPLAIITRLMAVYEVDD